MLTDQNRRWVELLDQPETAYGTHKNVYAESKTVFKGSFRIKTILGLGMKKPRPVGGRGS
jgi:hypothetical protein